MPIIIPSKLPASSFLAKRNVFVMNETRATHQDIRPLEILLLNIMPTKIETENQLLRVLANSPLQVNVTLLKTSTYTSKNISSDHMEEFYTIFEQIECREFDGMIITGAPLELMEFEQVKYYDELKRIMDYSKKSVTSTVYICWGAQVGLYYHFGIKKSIKNKKISGIFSHRVLNKTHPLMRGIDDRFFAPHSRYATNSLEEIEKVPQLEVLATSDEAGLYIASTKDMKQVFITGHPEYSKDTLKYEYERDIKKGLAPNIPKNYFENNDPGGKVVMTWRSHAHLFFSNWINYAVYQETPYILKEKRKNEI